MPKRKKKGDAWRKKVGPRLLKEIEPIVKPIEEIAAQKPPWVCKIWRLMLASVRRAYNIKGNSDRAMVMTIGIGVGHFATFGKTKFKTLPRPKGLPSEAAKALKAFPQALTPLQEHMGKLSKRMHNAMCNLPPEILSTYTAGYRRALAKRQYSTKEPIFWETTATRIYLVLIMLEPHMTKIKSVSELHKILSVLLGETVVGRLNDVKQSKRLGKLCERIGLRFPRGRPKIDGKAKPKQPTASRRSSSKKKSSRRWSATSVRRRGVSLK